jgi:5-methylcytosine-specific restriction protein B
VNINSSDVSDEEDWYRDIVEHDIKPLLREYWFDDREKADKEIGDLLNANTD